MKLDLIINDKDKIGLHARPAALLVKRISNFNSEIEMDYKGKRANLKSIMSVLSLGVKDGEKISIEITKLDSSETADEIFSVIKEEMKNGDLI